MSQLLFPRRYGAAGAPPQPPAFLGGRPRAVAELELSLLGFQPPAPHPGRLALPAGYTAVQVDPQEPEEAPPRAAVHPITGETYSVLDASLAPLAPRGLWFDGRGVLWILTNDVLAADPIMGQVRLFLVAPRPGAITNVFPLADARSMRVSLRYGGGAARPGAATLLIRRTGGGVVGA